MLFRSILIVAVRIDDWTSDNAPRATATSASATRSDPVRTSELQSDYARSWVGTSWYDPDDVVSVHGSTVDMKTNIFPDSEGKEIAKRICIGISSLVFANDSDYDVDSVRVWGQGDNILASRHSRSDTCNTT